MLLLPFNLLVRAERILPSYTLHVVKSEGSGKPHLCILLYGKTEWWCEVVEKPVLAITCKNTCSGPWQQTPQGTAPESPHTSVLRRYPEDDSVS